MMDFMYEKHFNSTEPEVEVVQDPFTLDVDII